MARKMYDSVTAGNCPAGAEFYLAYVDGRYANYLKMRELHPAARIVGIAVFAFTAGADCYDVERFDIDPSQVPLILDRERKAGRNPTIYVGAAQKQAVIDAIGDRPQPPWGIAHYTEVEHLEPGSAFTQWSSNDRYDTSMVADYWPGIDPTDQGVDMPLSDADLQKIADDCVKPLLTDFWNNQFSPKLNEILVRLKAVEDKLGIPNS